MNAPLLLPLGKPPSAAELIHIATIWRGAMLNLFARCEVLVHEALLAIESAGVTLPKDARHLGVRARLNVLSNLIEQHELNGGGKAVRGRLAEWEKLLDQRCALAHGVFEFAQCKAVLRHTDFTGGKEKVRSYGPLGWQDMLSQLVELEKLQNDLRSQLGQVRADCRNRKLAASLAKTTQVKQATAAQKV